MYNIYFYKDKNNKEPVIDYIASLSKSRDKNSKIKLKKILQYIDYLKQFGFSLKEPYIKHLDGEIWELRPSNDRIFFIGWYNRSFVLLHCFTKKTQKTPRREIEKAKKELDDMIERGLFDE